MAVVLDRDFRRCYNCGVDYKFLGIYQMVNEDKIKNIRLIYYKGSHKVKQTTVKKLGRKITNLLASLNWKKWSRIELTVRYVRGENSMALHGKEDALWANQAFIKEYGYR